MLIKELVLRDPHNKVLYRNKEASYMVIPPYNMKMYVLHGDEARRFCKAYSGDAKYLERDSGGASCDFQDGWLVYCLFGDKPTINTIVHEAGHSVHSVEEWVSLESGGSQEAQCYLLGWMTDEIISWLKSIGVKVKI